MSFLTEMPLSTGPKQEHKTDLQNVLENVHCKNMQRQLRVRINTKLQCKMNMKVVNKIVTCEIEYCFY